MTICLAIHLCSCCPLALKGFSLGWRSRSSFLIRRRLKSIGHIPKQLKDLIGLNFLNCVTHFLRWLILLIYWVFSNSTLSLTGCVSGSCKSANLCICDLYRIWLHFPTSSKLFLVNALVSSHFDCCNSLLTYQVKLAEAPQSFNSLASVIKKINETMSTYNPCT